MLSTSTVRTLARGQMERFGQNSVNQIIRRKTAYLPMAAANCRAWVPKLRPWVRKLATVSVRLIGLIRDGIPDGHGSDCYTDPDGKSHETVRLDAGGQYCRAVFPPRLHACVTSAVLACMLARLFRCTTEHSPKVCPCFSTAMCLHVSDVLMRNVVSRRLDVY